MSDAKIDSPLNDIQIGEVTAAWASAHQFKVKYTPQTGSTNDDAKNEAFTDEALENEFILYTTDDQTKGRGRFDRTWTGPRKGSALYSTWSFLIEELPQPRFTALVGLALYNAALTTWPFLEWSLKAPNDLFIKDKKVAGLLIETLSQGADRRLIIGVGLNVFASPESVPTATSILKNLDKDTPLLGEDWIQFLERFFFELSLVVPTAHEDLTTTQKKSLITALNRHPHLEKKYSSIKELFNETGSSPWL